MERHFWARWSDAIVEAGFAPNQFQGAFDKNELARLYANLAKELGHLPVEAELALKRRSHLEFPSDKTFWRLGNKSERIRAVREYCIAHSCYEDVLGWCDEYLRRDASATESSMSYGSNDEIPLGSVYLVKSGGFYKIGKTNSIGRREYELGLKLPERIKTIHVITTDDPSGIEAYWHNRFADRRKNGEWFDLKAEDISAFKRWRLI